jgi:TolB-like protein
MALIGVTVLFAAGLFISADVFDGSRTLSAGTEQANTGQASVRPARTTPSIAVLPFENMSGDIGNEHFGDGLAEEIRSLLANNPDLTVIGRSSSSAFIGSNIDLKEIGQQLGVSTLLEGSVRRSGETLRVTVQLIDSAEGSSIWAHTYERPMTNIFAVQDAIAAAVISRVEGKIALQPNRRLPTEDIEAYALYVEAQGLLGNFSVSNVKAAEERLLRAVELDPNFAEAYEQLAFTYWEQTGVAITGNEGQVLQRKAAAEAIRLDPELAFARFLWSDVIASTPLSEILDDLTALARTGQRKPFVLGTLTWYLIYTGYFRDALVFAQRYLEHDPYSANAHRQVHYALLANGRQRESIEALEIAARLGRGPNALHLARWRYVLQRDEESIAAYADAWRDNGIDAVWLPELLLGAAHPDTGQEYLDRRMPEILASVPDEQMFLIRWHVLPLYLQFGYLDRYYELIDELGIDQFGEHIEFTWIGTMLRDSGFTAHPGYQRIAHSTNFHELWDTRGPPDMCEKRDNKWVCE